MLVLSEKLLNRPIMSLRTGSSVGTAVDLIIDPNSLKIEGWHCTDRFNRKTRLVLQAQEIRDIINQGIVVNDHEALSQPSDLVRLKKILSYNFTLKGKPVFAQSGRKIGKVEDFAVESSSLFVQKIYVAQPLLKTLGGGSVSIDRSQIIEITNRKIVVADPTIEEKVPVVETAGAS